MTMEALRPPNIEPAVIELLQAEPWGIRPWVSETYPSGPGEEDDGVIRVSLTGGMRPVDLVVITATVLVECWHDDSDAAWSIASKAYSRLMASSGRVIRGVNFNYVASSMPNNNPDVNRQGMVRYQFLSEIWTRLQPEGMS